MPTRTQISIPTLVRVKVGALDRIGLYAARNQFTDIVLLASDDLNAALMTRLHASLAREHIRVLQEVPIQTASFEQSQAIFTALPAKARAIIGVGGGKALDVAKYTAFLSRQPYIAVPTSLSNDGFCSPQSSLTLQGRRRSLPSAMPFGVVLDTDVCLQAPEVLWLSGVGDLVSKITAVHDWRLAFHAQSTPVDDFAALLSDATVFQFMAQPERNLHGVQLLGTALMLNGVAMEICGSSRPASGSEHLISHALDSICKKPHLHGLQVGLATYVVCRLQGQDHARINGLFEKTGFWKAIRDNPFSRKEWMEAVRMAPSIKQNYYTILSARDCLAEVEDLVGSDPALQGCFTE